MYQDNPHLLVEILREGREQSLRDAEEYRLRRLARGQAANRTRAWRNRLGDWLIAAGRRLKGQIPPAPAYGQQSLRSYPSLK